MLKSIKSSIFFKLAQLLKMACDVGYHQSVILHLFQILNKIVTISKTYFLNVTVAKNGMYNVGYHQSVIFRLFQI